MLQLDRRILCTRLMVFGLISLPGQQSIRKERRTNNANA